MWHVSDQERRHRNLVWLWVLCDRFSSIIISVSCLILDMQGQWLHCKTAALWIKHAGSIRSSTTAWCKSMYSRTGMSIFLKSCFKLVASDIMRLRKAFLKMLMNTSEHTNWIISRWARAPWRNDEIACLQNTCEFLFTDIDMKMSLAFCVQSRLQIRISKCMIHKNAQIRKSIHSIGFESNCNLVFLTDFECDFVFVCQTLRPFPYRTPNLQLGSNHPPGPTTRSNGWIHFYFWVSKALELVFELIKVSWVMLITCAKLRAFCDKSATGRSCDCCGNDDIYIYTSRPPLLNFAGVVEVTSCVER